MYNWEKSKSKSNSKHKHKHSHHHQHHQNQNDPKNPTCSSSFFNKFNKSLKTHYPKSHQNDDFCSTKTKTPKNRGLLSSSTPSSIATTPIKDEKMSSLRRACLVEKWMEKKGNDKVVPRIDRDSSSSSTTLLDEFDLHDALFFSTTTTNTTTSSSSSSSEIDYSVFSHPKQKPRVACFTHSKPKPIKTHTIESKFISQFGEENGDFMKDRSKAADFYSNLKNLKQPISPGVRLSSFINSLFAKDGKNRKKKASNNGEKQSKTEEYVHSHSHLNSYSSCSSVSSFSRSCMSKKKDNNKNNNDNEKYHDDGIKRTVRFCPVSVIVDDDSQACGYKSLREEKGENLLNSNFGRSLSKKYEELRKLNGLEKENGDKLQQQQQQKKLEEVALDLLSGYWDARLNKSSHDLCGKDKSNDGNYGVNLNYDHHEDVDDDDDDDDGFSCSSSDLFELDHLSLIENELPVYETTQINTTKIM